MERILNYIEQICLFCGQPLKEYWYEYESYYDCDCPDTIETKKIRLKFGN